MTLAAGGPTRLAEAWSFSAPAVGGHGRKYFRTKQALARRWWMMSRDEELDSMTLDEQKADLLKNLNRPDCDFLRLDRKPQLAYWGAAIDALVEEGKVTCEFREVDEQYSYYRVELAKDG